MGNETPKLTKEGHPRSVKDFELLYKEYLVSAHNQKVLDEGICRGMCYDWIRLLLNDRGKQFIKYQSLGSQKIQRIYSFQTGINKLFLEGAELRIRSLISKSKKLNKLNIDTLGPQYQQARERAHLAAVTEDQMQKVLPILRKSGVVGQQELIKFRQALLLQTELVDHRIAKMNAIDRHIKQNLQKMKRIQKMITDDESNFNHYYEYFQAHFSDLINSNYGFDDIFYERGRRSGWHPKQLNKWLLEVKTYLSQLRNGCCALFNFRGPKSGHFIAFHRDGVRYSLFDPNVGWYRIQGVSNVWKMFVDLWYCAYTPFGYNESTWRVFFKVEPEPELFDPRYPIGHVIM